jgi:uncharacterized protein YdaU (DUF1376 family)
MAELPSKTDIWMPLYIGDYLAATAHLDAQESGAYLHLLMHQWKNGKLPAEPEALRRIARVERDAWSNSWAILIAFFDHTQGFPVQLRLENIREEWNKKQLKAKEKATNAAAVRWGKDTPSSPQALLDVCSSSSSSPSPIQTTSNPPENGTPTVSRKNFVPPPAEDVLQQIGLNLEDYESYMAVRKAKKQAFVDVRARDKWIAKWKKYYDTGYDTAAMFDLMISSGWIGAVEEKWTKRKMERRALTEEEAEAAWEKDFELMGMGQTHA